MTTGTVKSDRIWSLHPENEVVLKQVWSIFLKNFGYDIGNLSYNDLEKPANFVASKSKYEHPVLSEKSVLGEAPEPSQSTIDTWTQLSGTSVLELNGEYDKSVEPFPNEKHHLLSQFDDGDLHQSMINSMRNHSPDNQLLRFVRAKKYNLSHSISMIGKCWEWKAKSHNVDKWFYEGDYGIVKDKPEIIEAFAMEKAYMRGEDLNGGHVTVIRVKKHFGHDCPEEDFERFICMIIEWAKLAMSEYEPGDDGANILFDMTDFSLKNADLSAVRFLTRQFEANYPETLSAIWVHKAPWIFNAVWRMIKGWLDPIVASKIHFTKSVSDLEAFLDKKYIPKSLGGNDTYEAKYIPPTAENSGRVPKDEKYSSLMAERKKLMLAFLESTILWIKAKSIEESTTYLNYKIQLGGELAKNYRSLDPYVRYRGAFDRDGTLQSISI